MKTKKFYIVLLIISFLPTLLPGCSKKGNENDTDSLNAKIVGRWNFEKNVNHSVVSGVSSTEIENDGPGNYFQFNDDYSFAAGLDDGEGTGSWAIKSGKITISCTTDNGWEGIYWDIIEISGSKLTLYTKATSGSDVYEVTIYLTR